MLKSLKVKSLKFKLVFPLGGFGALLLALLLIKGQIEARHNFFHQESQTLAAYAGQVQNIVNERASQAMNLAEWLANTPEVQESFAAGNRERLKELTLPVYQATREKLGLVQCQFHLPPATSFLRLHQPGKFGDDLSSFRQTVVQANQEKKPVMGLEGGVGGIGLRGVAPIFAQGRHLGTVEFGLDLDANIFRSLEEVHQVEVTILLPEPPGFHALGKKNTGKEFAKQALQRVLDTGKPETLENFWNDNTFLTYLAPLKDYAGKNIGVLATSLNITQALAGLRQSLYFAIALGMILMALMLVVTYGIVHTLVSKPLKRNYETLRDIIVTGDLTRRVPMKQVKSSIAAKFGEMDFSSFGQKVYCWQEVGSNAAGKPSCPALLNGKYKNCVVCPVAQLVLEDEVDKLTGWINTFIKQLSDIIYKLTNNAGSLAVASGDLNKLSGKMSEATGEVAARLNTVTKAAEEMSGNQQAVAAAMEQTSANLGALSTAAEEMTATINEIAHRAEQGRVITNAAVSESQRATASIDKLNLAAGKIDQITDTITDISEQINLLSLNATIEAARAGEAGRGFAVVAQEIKALAQQTSQAIEEINQLVGGIKDSTSSSISEIGKITDVISEINESVSSIAAAVEEQSVTTQEIAHNVQQVSHGVEEVTTHAAHSSAMAEEVKQDITSLRQEVHALDNSSQQVLTNAEKLAEMAGNLRSMVEKFKVVR